MADGDIEGFIAEKRAEKVQKLVTLITRNAVRQGLNPQRDAARMAKAAREWPPKIWRKLGKKTGNSAGKVPSEETRNLVIAALEAAQVPVCELGHEGCTSGECAEIAGARADYLQSPEAETRSSLRSCLACFAWSAGDECSECKSPTWHEPGVCPGVTEREARLRELANQDFDAITSGAA
jgi:hypothetical protein